MKNLDKAKGIAVDILNAGMEIADNKFGPLQLEREEHLALSIQVANLVLRAWLSLENQKAIDELLDEGG